MSESFYGSTYHYIKCFLIWALVVGLDYLVDFRFEYLWPCWLLVRSVCDSYKYQGALFSAFFTCIAVASDVICYLFVPPMWIFFLGSTYVWVQFLWQTERGLCFPTVFMWIIFIYVEFAFRLRDAKSIPFSIDLCRPFAAHCIGYPVVSLGFGVKSYISYKFRLRRQKEVQAENQFYVQLLEQALPEDCRASKNEKESDSYSKAVPEESAEVSSGKKRHAASNGKLPVSSPGEDAQFCETRQLASHNGAAGASRRDSTPSSPSSSSPFTAHKSSVTCSDHVTSGSISDDVIAAGEAGPHSNNGAVSTGSGKGSTSTAAAAAAAVAAKNGLAGGGGGGKRVHNNTGGVPGKENNLHGGAGGKGSGVSGGGKSKAASQNAPLNNCVVLKKDDQNSRILRLESEIKRMRADLQSSRTNEQELRAQLGIVVASERSMKLDLNQTKQDNESLQNRLHNLVQRNQQDKCSLVQLEKRLNDEKRQRQSTEGALASEKKGRREDQEAAAARNTALAAAAALRNGQTNNNGASSPDGFCSGEGCRAKRHELEGVIKGLRRDVAKREEQLRGQERALEQMRQYREAAESQETLMTALNAMKEKNAHLDRALKDENRLKQELLSALHNGKRDMDVLQVIIADKDRQITELRMKMAEFAAVALSPSGYDASGAAGVFGPPPPPPPPPPQSLSNCRPPVSSPGPASQQQAPGSPPVVSCAASMPNGEH